MEDYLWTVSTTIASLGAKDPRLGPDGKIDIRLHNLRCAYTKEDPSPRRVKPVPIQLVLHAAWQNQSSNLARAISDLTIVGLFFLLRPGEHTYNTENNHPFRLQDTSFEINAITYNGAIAPLPQLPTANKVHLNFTDQKNGTKDEALTHGTTNDPVLSPTQAVARHVQHLRANQAPPTTPLHTVYQEDGTVVQVQSQHITAALRASCAKIGTQLGIEPKDISARALRAGGAMALLRADIDPLKIRLIGRWKSWAMLHYLHRSATDTTSYAQRMIAGGTFTIAQHAFLPEDVIPLVDKIDLDDD